MSHYRVLCAHKEQDVWEYLDKYTEKDDKDPYYVGDTLGYDYLNPITEDTHYEHLKKIFPLKMVKVKDFPFEKCKGYISEIVNSNGESLWWSDGVCSSENPEITKERAFAMLDEEDFCTICNGHL